MSAKASIAAVVPLSGTSTTPVRELQSHYPVPSLGIATRLRGDINRDRPIPIPLPKIGVIRGPSIVRVVGGDLNGLRGVLNVSSPLKVALAELKMFWLLFK